MATFIPASGRACSGVSSFSPSLSFLPALRRTIYARFGQIAVVLLLLGGTGIVLHTLTRPVMRQSALEERRTALTADSVLQVRAGFAERQYDYLVVTGEAKNLSSKSLSHVEAIVEFFDADGRLRRVETAPVEMSGIPAEGETPFRVQTPDDPAICVYRVRFRTAARTPLL